MSDFVPIVFLRKLDLLEANLKFEKRGSDLFCIYSNYLPRSNNDLRENLEVDENLYFN